MDEKLDLELIRRSAEPGAMFGAILVRDLVDRLEQAESELVAVKSTQVQHIVKTSFETARTAGIALDEAVKLVAGWLIDDPVKRARVAEQQVARVRELHSSIPAVVNFYDTPTDYCDFCGDEQYPCSTIRALDGEQDG